MWRGCWWLSLVAMVSACDRSTHTVARQLTGGEPDKGKLAIVKYGCDTCHTESAVVTFQGTRRPDTRCP